MQRSASRGSFSGFVNLLRGRSPAPGAGQQPLITARALKRYLKHDGPATRILRVINFATLFVSMMVFGAAFYSMMVSGDNRIAQVFPIASWGSGLLFTAGTILMLLSIKGYYSVTKRSVKLLATYYALMQIVFVCVGIVTLTAWNKLPDIEKEIRDRCTAHDPTIPDCSVDVDALMDEIEDHMVLLVQCGLAITVLCFLKSQATFGVVAEILLERCKYSATPFGMSPAYGSDEDDWQTDLEGGTPGGSVYGFPINRPRVPGASITDAYGGPRLSRSGSQRVITGPAGVPRAPSSVSRMPVTTPSGYSPPPVPGGLIASRSPPSLLQQVTTAQANAQQQQAAQQSTNTLQQLQQQVQAQLKAREQQTGAGPGQALQSQSQGSASTPNLPPLSPKNDTPRGPGFKPAIGPGASSHS